MTSITRKPLIGFFSGSKILGKPIFSTNFTPEIRQRSSMRRTFLMFTWLAPLHRRQANVRNQGVGVTASGSTGCSIMSLDLTAAAEYSSLFNFVFPGVVRRARFLEPPPLAPSPFCYLFVSTS